MKHIAAALVAAQKSFEPARKQSDNPHFRSKYASLENCIDAVIDALHANGIMLCQPNHECPDGVIVETLFIHESGETFSAGKLRVPAAKQDPQGYGSALTYARRYSLLSACGIAPEDDDGNAAVKATEAAKEQAQQKNRVLFDDALAAIDSATTLEELSLVYTDIYKASQGKPHIDLVAAKDKRKKELGG